jgi:hypothetical protein
MRVAMIVRVVVRVVVRVIVCVIVGVIVGVGVIVRVVVRVVVRVIVCVIVCVIVGVIVGVGVGVIVGVGVGVIVGVGVRGPFEVGQFLVEHIIGKLERHLIENGERTDWHARLHGGILDQRGGHPFTQQRHTFIHKCTEYTAGVEAAGIIDNDGRFANGLHEIEGLCQGLR